eukprot:CAMPEP_0168316330 /NCGR_PEP_ID=MMETSP0210-20121227/15210_1 /TAXON_ID=40633 /ORGANISM="Condylostoma magnum, Strain COL2" /LENGTH=97 /DNA_ID=CAMNT_0008296533 /DNA_START=1407 /DNA_END=1700 /DNA_ORIENTATION=-
MALGFKYTKTGLSTRDCEKMTFRTGLGGTYMQTATCIRVHGRTGVPTVLATFFLYKEANTKEIGVEDSSTDMERSCFKTGRITREITRTGKSTGQDE